MLDEKVADGSIVKRNKPLTLLLRRAVLGN
jgi:hypothetical protein